MNRSSVQDCMYCHFGRYYCLQDPTLVGKSVVACHVNVLNSSKNVLSKYFYSGVPMLQHRVTARTLNGMKCR